MNIEQFNLSEDVDLLSNLNKIFKQKRKALFYLPKNGDSVILLYSGGLDSTSLFNYLCSVYKIRIFPLFVNTNSSQCQKQLKSACFFVDFFKKKYKNLVFPLKVVKYNFLFSFSLVKKINKDLFNMVIKNIVETKKDDYSPAIIASPSRLGIYGLLGFEYLLYLRYIKNIDINTILTGIVPEDRMLRESNLSILRSINLFLCAVVNDYSIQFSAPIEKKFFLSKEKLVKQAVFDNVPLEKTYSCIENADFHCGRCFNCLYRKKTFEKIKFNDKTKYKKVALNKIRSSVNSLVMNIRKKWNDLKIFRENKIFLSESKALQISKEILWTEEKGEIVLFNPINQEIQVLNRVGKNIWKFIESNKNCTISDLIEFLQRKYNIDKKTIQSDLTDFITYFLQAKIIKIK